MTGLSIVEPLLIAAVAASRGSGAVNVLTPDPKEAWANMADAGDAVITIDLGRSMVIDTIYLGTVQAAAGATWALNGGVATSDAVIQAAGPLGRYGLWQGTSRDVRYISVSLRSVRTAGILVVGRSFSPALGHEWGSGRRPMDMGAVTELRSGGFAVVPGARKRAVSWTFGDLSQTEADQLESIALRIGEGSPALVTDAGTAYYGLFERWRAFERRNRAQTRWEVGLVEWV